MKEIITLQVGQCGNQIGWRFWDLLRHEHAYAANPLDDSLTTFFRPYESRVTSEASLRNYPDTTNSTSSSLSPDLPAHFLTRYRARAILLDMEEGVVSQLLRAPIHPLFGDSHMRLTDVSGAGNNWACGYAYYGPQYSNAVMELVRRNLEFCESPQAFLLLHSLGGGTGSGFGSYILEQLADNFPEQYRFTSSLMPSRNDDVITSPYNNLLATARLIECADAVLPIDNQRLMDVIGTTTKQIRSADKGSSSVMELARLAIQNKSSILKKPHSNSNNDVSPSISATKESLTSSSATDSSSSTVSSDSPAQIAPALERMLAQADAVLDAVTYGLISITDPRVPSKSGSTTTTTTTTTTTKKSGIPTSNPKVTPKSSSLVKPAGTVRISTTVSSRIPSSSSSSSSLSRPGSVGKAIGTSVPSKLNTDNDNKTVSKVTNRTENKSSMNIASNTIRNRGTSLSAGPTATSSSTEASLASTTQDENTTPDEHEDYGTKATVPSTNNNGTPEKRRSGTPYDAMNTLVAHMLSNLTASMRFPGSLNVDLNEITSTLVPFPRLHFLSTSLAPLVGNPTTLNQMNTNITHRLADTRLCERIVSQGFSNSNLLLDSDIRNGTHLACGMLLRGSFAISDVNAIVQRQQRELRMVSWNPDGFKIGLCSSPPLYTDAAALCISNNCSVKEPLTESYTRFVKLYRARAHVHHYLEYISADEFQHAAEAVSNLINQYNLDE